MQSRRLISWLFALILMFGQAAAFAHTLTHLQTHDTTLPDKVCEVCVAQAQLGGMAPPSTPVLAFLPGDNIVPFSAAPLRVDLAAHPACARAPPAPFSP